MARQTWTDGDLGTLVRLNDQISGEYPNMKKQDRMAILAMRIARDGFNPTPSACDSQLYNLKQRREGTPSNGELPNGVVSSDDLEATLLMFSEAVNDLAKAQARTQDTIAEEGKANREILREVKNALAQLNDNFGKLLSVVHQEAARG